MMQKIKAAELYSKEKHLGTKGKDGITPYYIHLESVVNRLKNLGITDEDILSAAWLHDTLEYTNTVFDDIEQRFGSKVAVLVLSLSKDKSLAKAQQESQYIKQIMNASWEAKIIKLCDISSNLKDIKKTTLSKTKRSKEVKKELHYLNLIKLELIQNKSQILIIQKIIDWINDILTQHGQRPVVI